MTGTVSTPMHRETTLPNRHGPAGRPRRQFGRLPALLGHSAHYFRLTTGSRGVGGAGSESRMGLRGIRRDRAVGAHEFVHEDASAGRRRYWAPHWPKAGARSFSAMQGRPARRRGCDCRQVSRRHVDRGRACMDDPTTVMGRIVNFDSATDRQRLCEYALSRGPLFAVPLAHPETSRSTEGLAVSRLHLYDAEGYRKHPGAQE